MTNDQTLCERVETLERSNRRFKRAFLGLAGLVTVLGLASLAGQRERTDATYRIVYASKFALLDPATQRVRAELAHQVSPGGWAGMTLWDQDGQPRAELKAWEDGRTMLRMLGPERQEASHLAVSADGVPVLTVAGEVVAPE